jgi:hypothetical protein
MVEPAYEMLWDCSYCGTKKLLGLTHRHCPQCGAKQDSSKRYFPEEHEKVAVAGHEFVGADLVCRYCAAAGSRRARNCGQCGAPLSEGAPVPLVAEPVTSQVAALSAQGAGKPPARAAWKTLLPIAVLMLVGVVVVMLLWKKDRRFVVTSRSWQRTIQVERFGPVKQAAWCDALPAGARDVSRHRERRGTKQVLDGQECQTKRQDRGDGTFIEKQECRPKHRDEPVYDDKCDYSVDRWSTSRKAELQGAAPEPPRWPESALSKAGCNLAGCEREGARAETYTLVLSDADGESYRCELPESLWSRFVGGKSYPGKVRAVVGSLDCSSLVP